MANFKVGQKVVCVDDSAGIVSNMKTLKNGEIYEIIELRLYARPNPCIVVNDDTYMGWAIWRFAPIESIKYDVPRTAAVDELLKKEIVEERLDVEKINATR